MLSQLQLKAASYIAGAIPAWTHRENAKTIVFTSPEGDVRYVVRPQVTRKERKHSRELGGTWFPTKTWSTKNLAARAKK